MNWVKLLIAIAFVPASYASDLVLLPLDPTMQKVLQTSPARQSYRVNDLLRPPFAVSDIHESDVEHELGRPPVYYCQPHVAKRDGINGLDFIVQQTLSFPSTETMTVDAGGKKYESGGIGCRTPVSSPIGRHGRALVIPSGMKYGKGDLKPYARLEDLRVYGITTYFNRFKEVDGLSFAQGSQVHHKQYVLVESKEKRIVLKWDAPENFDDYYQYYLEMKYEDGRWKAFIGNNSPRYVWTYHEYPQNLFYRNSNMFVDATFEETADELIVTVKRIGAFKDLKSEVMFTGSDPKTAKLIIKSHAITHLSNAVTHQTTLSISFKQKKTRRIALRNFKNSSQDFEMVGDTISIPVSTLVKKGLKYSSFIKDLKSSFRLFAFTYKSGYETKENVEFSIDWKKSVK